MRYLLPLGLLCLSACMASKKLPPITVDPAPAREVCLTKEAAQKVLELYHEYLQQGMALAHCEQELEINDLVGK